MPLSSLEITHNYINQGCKIIIVGLKSGTFFGEKTRKNKNDLRIKILYVITLTVGIIGPLANLPQILKIFIEQNPAGVSLLSWSLYVLLDIPFILWSIVQKDKPVFVTYSLWFISNLLVVVGVLTYN